MKYRVENKLDLFEFHDAEFSFISFDKNELVLSAKHLNIHENAVQNPHNCDMEIDFAEFDRGILFMLTVSLLCYLLPADGSYRTFFSDHC